MSDTRTAVAGETQKIPVPRPAKVLRVPKLSLAELRLALMFRPQYMHDPKRQTPEEHARTNAVMAQGTQAVYRYRRLLVTVDVILKARTKTQKRKKPYREALKAARDILGYDLERA